MQRYAQMKIDVKIKLTRGAQAPEYATDGSAAVDLRAALPENEPITIAPGSRALIPTGLAISPERTDVVAILAARSGLAIKQGICLSNGIGVIDSDYRGEVKVGLINLSDSEYTVKNGDRIAQMVIAKYEKIEWEEVDQLGETERGAGGFGSTGVK